MFRFVCAISIIPGDLRIPGVSTASMGNITSTTHHPPHNRRLLRLCELHPGELRYFYLQLHVSHQHSYCHLKQTCVLFSFLASVES